MQNPGMGLNLNLTLDYIAFIGDGEYHLGKHNLENTFE